MQIQASIAARAMTLLAALVMQAAPAHADVFVEPGARQVQPARPPSGGASTPARKVEKPQVPAAIPSPAASRPTSAPKPASAASESAQAPSKGASAVDPRDAEPRPDRPSHFKFAWEKFAIELKSEDRWLLWASWLLAAIPIVAAVVMLLVGFFRKKATPSQTAQSLPRLGLALLLVASALPGILALMLASQRSEREARLVEFIGGSLSRTQPAPSALPSDLPRHSDVSAIRADLAALRAQFDAVQRRPAERGDDVRGSLTLPVLLGLSQLPALAAVAALAYALSRRRYALGDTSVSMPGVDHPAGPVAGAPLRPSDPVTTRLVRRSQSELDRLQVLLERREDSEGQREEVITFGPLLSALTELTELSRAVDPPPQGFDWPFGRHRFARSSIFKDECDDALRGAFRRLDAALDDLMLAGNRGTATRLESAMRELRRVLLRMTPDRSTTGPGTGRPGLDPGAAGAPKAGPP